jgi:uncharacterized membrane protein
VDPFERDHRERQDEDRYREDGQGEIGTLVRLRAAGAGIARRPVERAPAAAALALVCFLVSWGLLHVGFWRHDQVVDTPVYQRYGEAMERGDVPYRDFTPEYPPLALPAFVVPALISSGDDGFRFAFELEMLLCGLALVAFVAVASRGSPVALALVAVFPLLLGTVVLTRFDLWPAALTAAALAALLRGRDRLGAGVLGAAVAAKLYPAVLLPVALTWIWRRRGRRAALAALGVFVAVLLVCFVPFLVLGPGGVVHSFGRQLGRPLQIESLGAGFLLAAHQAFGLGIEMRSGAGSQNLVGTLPDVLAVCLSILQAAALVAIWARFARGPAEPERLVRYSAAAVVAFVALGKVLSPQFLIWLVPLVALVRGRAAALLVAAMVVTQIWFPFRYWDLVREFDPLASWVVPLRDLLLVALLAELVRRRRGRARTA